jgi:hypothetical protein
MKLSRSARTHAALCLLLAAALAACSPGAGNTNTGAQSNANASATPAAPQIAETERPQSVRDKMAQRGAEEEAKPVLKIVQPADGSTVNGSTVRVRLDLSGDLKGYKPHKDPATNMGNHIHVILDNEPYEAYYELDQPFELRNVSEGPHTLRVFASRPWHESYKNDGSFQMVSFTVRGGGDPTKPTTTNGGQVMSNNNSRPAANTNSAASNSNANAAATPAPTAEGKDYAAKPNAAGAPDRARPLLTYSRPKGEYKDADAEAIMIDFWLTNAKLEGDGGEYRVRYSVDGGAPKYLSRWEPIWLKGWTAGKHRVKVELVNRDDTVVQNAGYNSTEREITVVK